LQFAINMARTWTYVHHILMLMDVM